MYAFCTLLLFLYSRGATKVFSHMFSQIRSRVLPFQSSCWVPSQRNQSKMQLCFFPFGLEKGRRILTSPNSKNQNESPFFPLAIASSRGRGNMGIKLYNSWPIGPNSHFHWIFGVVPRHQACLSRSHCNQKPSRHNYSAADHSAPYPGPIQICSRACHLEKTNRRFWSHWSPSVVFLSMQNISHTRQNFSWNI